MRISPIQVSAIPSRRDVNFISHKLEVVDNTHKVNTKRELLAFLLVHKIKVPNEVAKLTINEKSVTLEYAEGATQEIKL